MPNARRRRPPADGTWAMVPSPVPPRGPGGQWAWGPPIRLGPAPYQPPPWKRSAGGGQHVAPKPKRRYHACNTNGCKGWDWADLGRSCCKECGATYAGSVETLARADFEKMAPPLQTLYQGFVDKGHAKILEPPVPKDPVQEAQAALSASIAAAQKVERQYHHQRTTVHVTRCKLERLVAKEEELKAELEELAKAQQKAVAHFQRALDANRSGRERAVGPEAAAAAATASGGGGPELHPAFKALRDENAELRAALAQALAAIGKLGAAATGAVAAATPQTGTTHLPEQATQASAAAAAGAGQAGLGASSLEPKGLPPDGAAAGRVRPRGKKKDNEDDMESESDGEDARSRSDKGSRRRVRPRPESNAEGDPTQHGEEGYHDTLDRAAKMQETINEALRAAGQSSG